MALRATFVAEVGSALPTANGGGSEYMCRAKCTRCSPEFLGPTYKLSLVASANPALVPTAALERVRDKARVDVLRHVDGFHAGKAR